MKESFPTNSKGRIIVFIIAVILICAGVLLSFQDKSASAGVTYTAAILCLIFSFLHAFKKFKGLGVEAELLDKKIEEAGKKH